MWRIKEYICGEMKDIEIFVRPERTKPIKRSIRKKESSPAQKNLNNKNSEKYLVRLVHTNFTRRDLFIDLTFDENNLPKTRKEAIKKFKNYIARINRYRKKQGKKKAKYIYVFSERSTAGERARFHFHAIFENMEREVLEEKWGYGYANTDRLKFDEFGVTAKVKYMARQGGTNGTRTWGASTGLKKVVAKISDKKITGKIARELERNSEDREYIEKLFNGKNREWFLTDCEVEYNIITGLNFNIRMRKDTEKWKKT